MNGPKQFTTPLKININSEIKIIEEFAYLG